MRRAIPLIVLFAGLMPGVTLAQSGPLRIVATHVVFPTEQTASYSLQCPAGYVPTGFSLAGAYRFDTINELFRNMIDSKKSVIDRRSVASATTLDGAGFSATMENIEHHYTHLEVMLMCLSPAATSDNTLVVVSSSASVPPSGLITATSFCPAEYPAALGGFSSADRSLFLTDAGAGPVWGTSSNPLYLYDVPDGQTGPPTGWQVRVLNLGTLSRDIFCVAVCGKVPGLQTFVYSASVPQAQFAKTAFSVFAPVPDGWTALGSGYAGGRDREFWYGEYFASDAWTQDGVIVNMLQWYWHSGGYDSGSAEVRAFIAHGLGAAPSGGARAKAAVLAVPKAPSPTSTVDIVEYYHSALDHYFITGIPDEIAKLDNGTFVGWQRTGQTFRAYAPGSGGPTGRRPVCREYGKPEYGLDTHFYSASPDECYATLANSAAQGNDPVETSAWGLEASEVFQMDLPDPATGACPAGGVPVYRVWNRRIDSNHRYTTSIAIRDQMVAKGGVAEGYGPNAVALCGL